MNRPIEAEWLEFRQQCVDPLRDLDATAIAFLRQTFFAGALCAHGLLFDPLKSGDSAGFFAVHAAMKAEQELANATSRGEKVQ